MFVDGADGNGSPVLCACCVFGGRALRTVTGTRAIAYWLLVENIGKVST
jgi:hypothetical protein